jgi:hypothetical protein
MEGIWVRRVPYSPEVWPGGLGGTSLVTSGVGGASRDGVGGAARGPRAGPPDIEPPSTSTRNVRWISSRARRSSARLRPRVRATSVAAGV